MEKSITISDKVFNMKSSAATQFAYKDFTGRSLLKDLTSLLKYDKKDRIQRMSINSQMELMEEIQEILFRISFVMIKEFDKKTKTNQVTDYDEFLELIDSLDETSYAPILELACNPLQRQLQNNK